jgi:hypothetical protein
VWVSLFPALVAGSTVIRSNNSNIVLVNLSFDDDDDDVIVVVVFVAVGVWFLSPATI